MRQCPLFRAQVLFRQIAPYTLMGLFSLCYGWAGIPPPLPCLDPKKHRRSDGSYSFARKAVGSFPCSAWITCLTQMPKKMSTQEPYLCRASLGVCLEGGREGREMNFRLATQSWCEKEGSFAQGRCRMQIQLLGGKRTKAFFFSFGNTNLRSRFVKRS